MNCCLKKVWGCVSALIVLLLVLFFGVSYFVVPSVVNKLERTVREEFQLDKSSVVAIRQGSPLNAVQGKFDFLMLKADTAEVDHLAVKDLLLRADDVKLDLWSSLTGGKAEITGVGHSFIEFKVGEQALVDRWAPDLAEKHMTEPELSLHDGVADVSVLLGIGPLHTRVTVTGKIEPTGDGQVRLSVTKVSAGGVDVALTAINNAFKTLDPVVDLGKLQLDVNINKVVVEDGYIYIAADSEPPEAIEGHAYESEGTEDIEKQGGLLDRFRQISMVDKQERIEQLKELYGEMKKKGMSTAEQVNEFANKHLAGWKDDYRWLLEELDQVVESQLQTMNKDDSSAKADSGDATDNAASSSEQDGQSEE